MTKSQKFTPQKSTSTEKSQLNVINPYTAGIDLGSKEHWVCVPSDSSTENVRSFGCTT